jgi:hypothetical protein
MPTSAPHMLWAYPAVSRHITAYPPLQFRAHLPGASTHWAPPGWSLATDALLQAALPRFGFTHTVDLDGLLPRGAWMAGTLWPFMAALPAEAREWATMSVDDWSGAAAT